MLNRLARRKRKVENLPHPPARRKRKVVRRADHLLNRQVSQVKSMGRHLHRLANQARSMDHLPSPRVSQVKSMGGLIRRPASRAKSMVTAGNMAADRDTTTMAGADRVKARANRCFSSP